jgi:hypothetical protein
VSVISSVIGAVTTRGWRVFRITWDELMNHPQRILSDLRQLMNLGFAA